ncbi:MAG: short-chain dehydrogenase/reductase [Proteobacteria bacterium]|nr:short-chain dehydrogenase/reductase [Pseudomonadota bacterium]
MWSVFVVGGPLKQKVILITGCRAGIGLATALAAAKSGHVVYAGLRDVSTDAQLREAAQGLPVIPLQLDITKSEQRQEVVEQIVSEHGRIDVLINNAGIGIGGFLEELEEDELRNVLDVNILGTWAMTKACLPTMRKQKKGLVLMISSLSGRMAIPGIGAYCTAKFALEGMAETWRHELAPFGIGVILIQPGAYRTDMIGDRRRICRAASDASSPYRDLSANMMQWYDHTVVDKAANPNDLAKELVALLENRAPALRYPMGPKTFLRSIAIRLFPFWIIERFFQRVLNVGLK